MVWVPETRASLPLDRPVAASPKSTEPEWHGVVRVGRLALPEMHELSTRLHRVLALRHACHLSCEPSKSAERHESARCGSRTKSTSIVGSTPGK